jgi:hypothetical protein
VLADLRVLRRNASDHDHDHEDGKRDRGQENDRRSRRTRHAVGRKPAHDGRRDRRDDRCNDDRPDDRLCRPEQPDDPREQKKQPDEEPRHAAEVTQPARRREHRRQLAGFQRAELDRPRFCRLAGPVSLEEVS